MLQPPRIVDTDRLELSLREPWVLLIRICEKVNMTLPTYTIQNLRAIQVNPSELHLFWGMKKSPTYR